jgi:hypothetical protein
MEVRKFPQSPLGDREALRAAKHPRSCSSGTPEAERRRARRVSLL